MPALSRASVASADTPPGRCRQVVPPTAAVLPALQVADAAVDRGEHPGRVERRVRPTLREALASRCAQQRDDEKDLQAASGHAASRVEAATCSVQL